MKTQSLPERLAEYFVICGLPKNPSPYDVSKILTHAEEIIAPNTSIDFTRFPEPIVDIKIVSLREKEEIPEGYTCIKYSVSGKHKANILLNFGEEACICYRRGRDQPFIKDIEYVYCLLFIQRFTCMFFISHIYLCSVKSNPQLVDLMRLCLLDVPCTLNLVMSG
ncbi:unnamed protein product [Schistosoma curassoni]|uniref:RNA-dependent RNA polymerase n=1 Tax=Schistosoma curassoni TaxID=6186 RepID=A0A183JH17_9TREM|nr:unnamed protein product [Schistosoma curassoni]